MCKNKSNKNAKTFPLLKERNAYSAVSSILLQGGILQVIHFRIYCTVEWLRKVLLSYFLRKYREIFFELLQIENVLCVIRIRPVKNAVVRI